MDALKRASALGVIGISMKPGDHDSKVLAYLLRTEKMTFKDAESWAFSQYTDNGIDPFIEQIGLAIDIDDLYELLKQNGFNMSYEFIIGEAAAEYMEFGCLNLIEDFVGEFIWVSGPNEIELPDEVMILCNSYKKYYNSMDAECLDDIVEKYRKQWLEITLDLFEKYLPFYKKSVAKFNL